ncbi:MAG: adenylosuccinate lyase, partial [Actinomycetota bacterium]
NLETSFGIVFSQPVLLALVDAGKSRDEAYRIVQQDAATAWDNRISFRSILEDDERVKLSSTQLDNAFDVQRSIRHAARTIDALDSIGK